MANKDRRGILAITMALKNKPEQSAKPNRIRFVMLEADLNDGNFSELTQAITQALRPHPSAAKYLPPPSQSPRTLQGTSASVEDIEVIEAPEEQDIEDDLSEPETTPKTSKVPKKFPVPEYRHDLDLVGSGESFKDYAARHAPKSVLQKYLVSAMWLKEFGQSPTIDIHKAYTCFRTAGWSTKINEWDSAFRSLKQVNKIRRTENQSYAITPIGEDDVK